MKNFFLKCKQFARAHTPDNIRWKLGPYVAYLAYLFRMRIGGNQDAPKVLSIIDTIELVIHNNLSVIRFGDGEMSLMNKSDLSFQKSNRELSSRLKEIIQQNLKDLLICVPGIFGDLGGFEGVAFWFAMHHQFRYRQDWLQLLSPVQIYGDTLITRPYLGRTPKVKQRAGDVFKRLFKVWEGKDVVLIEGAKSRLGVGNDLFRGVASLHRILCPPENAYDKYEQILRVALRQSKDKLILLSLGPTAKVLAYDLFRAGFRVIDVGHVDMEYEMFLRQKNAETKVRYKYFAEIHETDPEDCRDPEYLSQIIVTIK